MIVIGGPAPSGCSRTRRPCQKQKTAEPTFERTTASKPQRMKDGFLWAEGMISPRPCTIRDMTVLEAEVALWHDDIKPSLLRGPLKLYSCADGKEVDCPWPAAKAMRSGFALRASSTPRAGVTPDLVCLR